MARVMGALEYTLSLSTKNTVNIESTVMGKKNQSVVINKSIGIKNTQSRVCQ